MKLLSPESTVPERLHTIYKCKRWNVVKCYIREQNITIGISKSKCYIHFSHGSRIWFSEFAEIV